MKRGTWQRVAWDVLGLGTLFFGAYGVCKETSPFVESGCLRISLDAAKHIGTLS